MKIRGNKQTRRWRAIRPSIAKHKKRVSLQDPFSGRLGRHHGVYSGRGPSEGGEGGDPLFVLKELCFRKVRSRSPQNAWAMAMKPKGHSFSFLNGSAASSVTPT